MNRMIGIVISIFLLFGVALTPITDGIKGWRTLDTTESFSVTTVAGQTTANTTLDRDLFKDSVAEVITVSSNISGESPIASAYTAATNKLLIAALNPSATHTLTVNYYADTDSDVMQVVGPFLGVIIIGGLVVMLFLKRKSRGG